MKLWMQNLTEFQIELKRRMGAAPYKCVEEVAFEMSEEMRDALVDSGPPPDYSKTLRRGH